MIRRAKRGVFKVLNNTTIWLLSKNYGLVTLTGKLIEIITNKKYAIVKVDYTENLPQRTNVKNEYLGYVYPATEINQTIKKIPKQYAKLGYNIVAGGVVASTSPFVLTNKKIYRQKYYTNHKYRLICYKTRLIGESSENFVYLRMINKPIELDKGIFLGGSWIDNWYHWVIEILSKVEVYEFLAERYKRYPIIIPEEVKSLSSHFSILEKVFPNNEFIYLNKDQWYRFNRIIWLDSPVISAPKFKKTRYNFMELDTNFDYELMKNYKNRFVKEFNKSNINKKRIFLARKQTRRPYNQDEIMNMLRKYNFEEIYMEKYSLEEQIKLFYNAEFIIGKTGAAWTNILFSNENTKALIFSPQAIKKVNIFSNLAQLSNIKLNYYFYNTPDLDWVELSKYEESIQLNVHEIEQIVIQMLS